MWLEGSPLRGSKIWGQLPRGGQKPRLYCYLPSSKSELSVECVWHMNHCFQPGKTVILLSKHSELQKWRSPEYYENNMHKMQLPFSNKLLGSTLTSEEKQERRQQQLRRLQELNARRREEKLQLDQERLDRLLYVQVIKAKFSVWSFWRRACCPRSFIRRSCITVKKLRLSCGFSDRGFLKLLCKRKGRNDWCRGCFQVVNSTTFVKYFESCWSVHIVVSSYEGKVHSW